MKLTIKGSSNKVFDIEIGEDATVLDLKNAIAQSQGLQATAIRLIYSGKVLADSNTLQSYSIADGHALHMVVAKPRPAAATAASPPPVEPIPTTPPPSSTQQPNSNPLPNFGMGGFPGMPGFPGMEGFDFNSLMNNPMVQQMMDQMINDPQALSSMIRNNPMFANNPMFQQLADNPEMIRQQMQAFRQAQQSGAASGATGSTGTPGFGAGANPFGAGANPFGAGANPFGLDFGQMMNNPMVQQMMQQAIDNPQAYADMLRSNPMFANNPMIQEIVNNPELLQQQLQMVRNMFGAGSNASASSPAGSTGASATPSSATTGANPFSTLLGQPAPSTASRTPIDAVLLQHLLEAPVLPQHQQLLNNAEVARGLNLIQQGIQICRRNGLMLLNNVPNIDQSLSQHIVGSAPAAAPAAPAAAPTVQMTPEQRFGPQLDQLNDMGFNDRQRNIEALTATRGNVNLAVEWLMTH